MKNFLYLRIVFVVLIALPILNFIYAFDENPFALIKITRGPYLQNVNDQGAIIRWETNVASSSEIELNNESYGSLSPVYEHRVALTGLESGKKYSYKLKHSSKTYTFTTAFIDSSRPFKFTVWGDSQDNPPIFKKIANSMLEFDPNFAIGVGDYVNNGPDLTQWDKRFFEPASDFLSKTPVFLALGNHDYGMDQNNNWDFSPNSQGLKTFQNFFEGPVGIRTYYSFDYGNSHFIVLDPNLNNAIGDFDITPGSEQYSWLLDDLEKENSRCARFRFVFFHEPAFINYWDGGYWDGEPQLRKNLVPLLSKYNITMALSGHAHIYERGILNDVTYITTGGSGGNLEYTQYREWEHILIAKPIHHYVQISINGDVLEFSAVAADGYTIDRDTIKSTTGCD